MLDKLLLKTAKNNINYKVTGLRFNFLWGRSVCPRFREGGQAQRGRGLAQAHPAARAHGPPRGAHARELWSLGLPHPRFRGASAQDAARASSRGGGSRSGLSGMLGSPRAGAAAGGGGTEARLCAGGGGRTRESHHHAHRRVPSFRAVRPFLRGCGVWAQGRRGGIPEGIPSPPPAAWRPGTHVSARPARIPPAAQRILARHPCLRRPGPHTRTALSPAGPRCPSPALCGAPAPASGTQRTGRGAAPDAGECGHRGLAPRRVWTALGSGGWGAISGRSCCFSLPLRAAAAAHPRDPAEFPTLSYPARVSLPPPEAPSRPSTCGLCPSTCGLGSWAGSSSVSDA